MFTTGSKLFLGATVFSFVAALVFGVTNGGADGWLGVIGLLSVAITFAFLFGVNYYAKDGNVSAMSADVETAPAAQPPVGRSVWPMLAGVGVATIAVGAETKPLVFKIGVVLVLAAAVEWMVQGWSERASADPAYNAVLRKRMLHPLEFPVLGAAGLAVIIYSFSRIMLWVSESGGPVVFVVIGALVLVGGFLVASKPTVKQGVVTGVCTIAALGLVSTGAVMAIDGQRPIEKHPTTSATGACNLEEEGPDEQAKIDERGSQAVASKASVGITVELRGGKLSAYELGRKDPQNPVTVSRGNIVTVIFKNYDPERRRLTANLGKFEEQAGDNPVTKRPQVCTTLVRQDGKQFLSFVIPKPSKATPEPYSFTVPGVDGAEVQIVVP
jgi:hypothetical protein